MPANATQKRIAQLKAAGYEVKESNTKPGKFRWFRTVDSDGASVPPLDCAETVFDTPEDAWRAVHEIEDWSSHPVCCPFCGGKDIAVSAEWQATSGEDADNASTLQEYQCRGDCNGRSFWA